MRRRAAIFPAAEPYRAARRWLPLQLLSASPGASAAGEGTPGRDLGERGALLPALASPRGCGAASGLGTARGGAQPRPLTGVTPIAAGRWGSPVPVGPLGVRTL